MNKSIVPSSFLSLILIIVASCQVADTQKSMPANDVASVEDTVSNIQETDTARLVFENLNEGYRAEETKLFDLIHTKLEVSFDWDKQYLNGVATLELSPYFYPQTELVLDAKGFDIHEVVSLDSAGRKPLQYAYDGEFLTIALGKSFSRDEVIILEIDYTAKPNEATAGGSDYITSDKGLYFIIPDSANPDLPRQIWTQGETEANSRWFPTIDAPNQRTTQEMYITVEENFTTLSNGMLIYSQLNENGTRTDYWKMEHPHAPYLFMMAIGEYATVTEKWEDLEVSYYVEPEYEQYAKAIFGNTPEMLSFFSGILDYKYPWSKYAQVVVRNFVSGAMENTTASTFMEALQVSDRELLDQHWDDIIAHELFHHWFGDLVTNESWSNLPLNESFATYSEYLWTEHKYGIDEADYKGWEEVQNYLEEAATKNVDLIRYYYDDAEDMFDRHSYDKGGRVLHMLRKYIGDDAFFASMSFYLKQHEFSDVEIHDLRLAFEEVTGEDLNWFFNQWFLAAGHPELLVTKGYQDGKLTLNVKQVQDLAISPVYTLPLYVDIYNGEEKERFAIVIDQVEEDFEFEVSEEPSLVVFDAEAQLLGEISFEKGLKELADQYRFTDKFLSRFNAVTKLAEHVQNDTARQVLIEAMGDSFWGIRQEAITAFYNYAGEDSVKIFNKIAEIAQKDKKSLVRADAMAILAAKDADAYKAIFLNGLQDPSYAVVGSSLFGYAQTSVENKEEIFKQYQDIDNINVLIPVADFYALKGTAEEFEWYKSKLSKTNGGDLYYLLQYFGQYLMKMPLSVQQQGVEILNVYALTNETFYIRLAALQALLLLEDVEGVREKIGRIKQEEKDERLKKIYSNL